MSSDGKPKLLVLASTYPKQVGGSDPSFVFDLNCRLTEYFDVVSLVPHFKGAPIHEKNPAGELFRFVYAPPVLEQLAYGGGVLSNLRSNKLLYLLIPIFMAAQFLFGLWIVWTRKINIIHAHWIFPQGLIAVLLALFKPGVRVVCTSHGGDLFGLNGRVINYVMRFILARTDLLTVVSQAMREQVDVRGLRCKSVQVIPMGVDITHFASLPDASVSRSALLFVGRLVEKKGVVSLIAAIRLLRDEGLVVQLSIAGGGPLFAECQALIDQLGLGDCVTLLGAVAKQDLPCIYRSCSICVVPSVVDRRGDQEGLGLVIVEALSAGRVVLASDLAAIKDVVQNGVNGLLFSSGDPVAIKEAIKAVLLDDALYCRLQNKARESIVGRFDLQSVAERYRRALLNTDWKRVSVTTGK